MTTLAHAVTAIGGIPSLAFGESPKADFSDTPVWLSVVKGVFILVYLLLSTLLVIWFERKVIGRMQLRPGPNRAGPFGLFQSLGDGLKLLLKEDPVPANVDKPVYKLAAIIAGTLCFVSFSIMPMGGSVWMFGHHTPLQLTDTPVAVLLALAVGGVGIYGIVLAGWSSGSTYPLLGAVRSSAQMISYEIAMGLSLVAVFLYSGSMSTSQIVASQHSLWNAIPLVVSFAIYLVTMVGETNRLPFDLAEGEGELTGGFHTEYASMTFAMFFLGEYINMFGVSALATTMFLGGPAAPPVISLIPFVNGGWWGLLWFTLKLWFFIWFFVWLRGALPRVRYDQFMRFGWKTLIPTALVWLVFLTFIRGANNGWLGTGAIHVGRLTFYWSTIIIIVIAAALALVVASVWDARAQRAEAAAAEPPPEEVDPYAGGFPVPPLPGQRLREPSLTASGLPEAPARVVPSEEVHHG